MLGRDCRTIWKTLWRVEGERQNLENALDLYDVQCLEKNALTVVSNTTLFQDGKAEIRKRPRGYSAGGCWSLASSSTVMLSVRLDSE